MVSTKGGSCGLNWADAADLLANGWLLNRILQVVLWWTTAFNHEYLFLIEIRLPSFVLARGSSRCCYSCDGCMVRIKGVLVILVRFVSTLKLYVCWLYHVSTLTIIVMRLLQVFSLTLPLAFCSSTF